MKFVTIVSSAGEGPDQDIVKLYETVWTRILQVTLRNGKTLAPHAAKEAVTIQCVSGEGVLIVGEERIPLVAGVIVPLEPGATHSVEAMPGVSVLVTRFLAATGPRP